MPEALFLAKLDEVAEEAFDDQCTGANPRYPLISELKQILLDSYYGRTYVESYEREQVEAVVAKAQAAAKAAAK